MNNPPIKEQLPIAVRAYVQPVNTTPSSADVEEKKKIVFKSPKPSQYVLVFDTETTTDAAQKLRFGTYQVRKAGQLMQEGIFYDPRNLSAAELVTLRSYVKNLKRDGFKLLTVETFIEEVFFLIGYKWRGHIVGFNLPFDLSRLAINHAPARGPMRGGFSFALSEHKYWPHIQVKHLSSRDSIIRFTALMKLESKGDRKKKRKYERRRGFFVDVKTLAAALTSESHSLDSLAKYLGIPSQKHSAEHGKKLIVEYIEYAVRDAQTTWECFEMLCNEYEKHGLSLTPLHTIHTEASIGKAYLKQMGIKPWRELQPDFPPALLGAIASSYYGGRSEVHIRRQIIQILYCDFLSMYPTVCALMRLWSFVIAKGMKWQDCTERTQRFLNNVSLADLQNPEIWPHLTILVQLVPQNEIYPVRAKYGDDAQYTIGTNHLESEQPLYYTLADCIAAKLLSGKTPTILRAIEFIPCGQQEGLRPVNIAGKEEYHLDPTEGDFFKRLIDLRSQIKKKLKEHPEQKEQLHSQQLALKILANATSYGIFIELIVKGQSSRTDVQCFGPLEVPFDAGVNKLEIPGTYFHPLLATLITGAARLMLAITERLTFDMGLDWAFCDTDSMALAKPDSMAQEEFSSLTKQVQDWFTPLNPYAEKQPLFKIEDENFNSSTGELQPLFCLAISSKRYALFNLENGAPRLRKVSAHGLGHLLTPYQRERTTLDLKDVALWQQDFWMEIITAMLRGEPDQPNFGTLPSFNNPAMSRYAATTPLLAGWFKQHNENKEYPDSVRPFCFTIVGYAKDNKKIKPVAPYDMDPRKIALNFFNRNTGESISPDLLKTALECLNQYHLHPESKFHNGDFTDFGRTERRHIKATAIQHIGKEANQWEEQYFLGFNPDAQIEYGYSQEQKLTMLQASKKTFGLRTMARESGLAPRHLNDVIRGRVKPSTKTLSRIMKATRALANS